MWRGPLCIEWRGSESTLAPAATLILSPTPTFAQFARVVGFTVSAAKWGRQCQYLQKIMKQHKASTTNTKVEQAWGMFDNRKVQVGYGLVFLCFQTGRPQTFITTKASPSSSGAFKQNSGWVIGWESQKDAVDSHRASLSCFLLRSGSASKSEGVRRLCVCVLAYLTCLSPWKAKRREEPCERYREVCPFHFIPIIFQHYGWQKQNMAVQRC